MRKKAFFWLILASLGNIASLQAAVLPFETEKLHLIDKIMENQNYCVSAFEEDKIFVHPQNIITTDQGLLIDLNGSDVCFLPLLQHDNNNGYFIQVGNVRDIQLASREETKGPCPNCGVNTTKRGICKNVKCWFYNMKVL